MAVVLQTNGSQVVLSVADNVSREIWEFERQEEKATEALVEIRARLALLRDLQSEVGRHGVPVKQFEPPAEPAGEDQ